MDERQAKDDDQRHDDEFQRNHGGVELSRHLDAYDEERRDRDDDAESEKVRD